MIYQESQRVRHIVGRLDHGDQLVEELTSFCREHDIAAAEIRGVGRLDAIELVRFEPEADDYVPVFDGEGDFDLLQLSGNVATLGDEIVARLQAVISADGPLSPQVLTGQLRSARAVEFEFVLDAFDDLELERRLDPETGMLGLQAIKKLEVADESDDQLGEASQSQSEPAESAEESESSSIGGQSMSWDDAAEASRETPSDQKGAAASGATDDENDESSPEAIYGDMDFDEPVIDAGDVLDHPKLGECRVIKVEEGDYIHIRMPRGKIRKLSLDVVDIEFREEENGRSVFEAQVAK